MALSRTASAPKLRAPVMVQSTSSFSERRCFATSAHVPQRRALMPGTSIGRNAYFDAGQSMYSPFEVDCHSNCCQGRTNTKRGRRGAVSMEAGEGTPNSGRGRERRRRDGIKRVVLKRGEATDAGVTEEPRLGTAENPEILEDSMSTVEKRLREQLEALGGEEFRQRRTVSWRDEDRPEKNAGEYRMPSRRDLKDGDEYMYTQTEFKEGEFPQWAQAYRDAAKNDEDVAKLFEGVLDDPKQMQARMEERLSKQNKSEMLQEKTGAAEPPQIVFKDFDPFDLNIWFQLHKQPTDDDADLLAGILRSWYMLGKIGAYNSANLQVSDREELLDLQKDEKNQASSLRYDTRPAPGESKVMLKTYLHNIGDLEFQNEWGKLWIDLGTSDALALDVLLNALLKFSDDYVGIKQIIFGGQLETWDGMMDKEDKEYMKIVI